MQDSYIGLWRNKPPITPRKKNEAVFPIEYIFPSGRQALSYCLNKVGLNRNNRIALPEWSSHCVEVRARRCRQFPDDRCTRAWQW